RRSGSGPDAGNGRPHSSAYADEVSRATSLAGWRNRTLPRPDRPLWRRRTQGRNSSAYADAYFPGSATDPAARRRPVDSILDRGAPWPLASRCSRSATTARNLEETPSDPGCDGLPFPAREAMRHHSESRGALVILGLLAIAGCGGGSGSSKTATS